MVLTPQLRQRIEMLQMTKLELSDLVTQQLGENPVLDEVQPEETSVAPELSTDDLPGPPAMRRTELPKCRPALGGENLGGETRGEQ
jgi:DNA-directed RNA polymerase specialized sigma54-like protein